MLASRRWAAHKGDTIAAISLAGDNWTLADAPGLEEGRREAYQALSCAWYRRLSEAGNNYARDAALSRGCTGIK